MKKNRNYAKLTFLIIIWLLGLSFFGSITFITSLNNFSVSGNGQYQLMGWIWMFWTHIIPIIGCFVSFFAPIVLFWEGWTNDIEEEE